MRSRANVVRQKYARAIALQELERKDMLTGNVLTEPLVVEFAVVSTPTNFPTQQSDRIAALPESFKHTHEWDRFAVEVFVRGNSDVPTTIDSLELDLSYETSLTSVVDVQFGQEFSQNRGFAIHDESGEVENIHAAGIAVPVTDSERVLFARIQFAIRPEFGDNARLDPETGSVGPFPLNLAVADVEAKLANSDVGFDLAEMPDAGIIPVIYDLNDDHQISLPDFSRFASVFGFDSQDPSGGNSWYADFNRSEKVDLVDFSFFVRNFGLNHLHEHIAFPSNYPEAWITEPDPGGGGQGTVDPDPDPNTPNPPEFHLEQFQPFVPEVVIPGANDVFFVFVNGFQVDFDMDVERIAGTASFSSTDEEAETGITLLTISLENEEVFEMEVEILLNDELIDTLAEFDMYWGFVSDYVAEVMSSVRYSLADLLDDSESDEP